MVSPKTQVNLKNAKHYFEEHLCADDYYSEDGVVRGIWMGRAAEILGLSGAVQADAFVALCENKHPTTQERLTLRQKTTRKEDGKNVANRRVFFDFTISPPKSVSVAALVGGDDRIVAAHAEAVKVAVTELENFASARVRRAGANGSRRTGNIARACPE